jgi:hypothetical protein
MKDCTNTRDAALVAGLVVIAATAWATNGSLPDATWVAAPADATWIPAPEDEADTAADALPSNAHTPAAGEEPAVVALERTAPQQPITVEERRLTPDRRIQADVIDKLAQAPNLSGKIGVESNDAVVTLSGYTTTTGQAQRAARYAGSVQGVKYVQNEIRPRLGGPI